MQGNIVFAIELIIFVFLFSTCCSRELKNILKETIDYNKKQGYEDNQSLIIMGLMLSFLTATLTYSVFLKYFEHIYFSNRIVYWFVFSCVADIIQRFFCNIIKIIDRKTTQFLNS